jgi:glycosyltransferase involved in cell wall biosynthesis
MKLSVVTPSLNQARYLGACLDSVRLAAEHAPSHEIEHIVIDGGSTDGTTDILRQQAGVRWVSEKDNGQSQAINKGLGLANGDILAYLCADDLYEPLALQRVLDVFSREDTVDVVYADFFFLEGDSGIPLQEKKVGVNNINGVLTAEDIKDTL